MLIGKIPDGTGRHDPAPHEFPEWMQREADDYAAHKRRERLWFRLHIAFLALFLGGCFIGGIMAAERMIYNAQQREAQP